MTNWEIYGNRLHGSDTSALYWANGRRNCSDWKIYNNLIYNNMRANPYNDVAIRLCGDANSFFYENTVYNNQRTSGSSRTGGVADCGSGGNIKNNIFYNNDVGGGYGNIASSFYDCSVGGTPDYNYLYGNNGKTGNHVTSTCYATGNCAGFVGVSNSDFRLVLDSPAKGAGAILSSEYATDFAGVPRPASAGWDLGAYQSSGSPDDPPSPPQNVRIVGQ